MLSLYTYEIVDFVPHFLSGPILYVGTIDTDQNINYLLYNIFVETPSALFEHI